MFFVIEFASFNGCLLLNCRFSWLKGFVLLISCIFLFKLYQGSAVEAFLCLN